MLSQTISTTALNREKEGNGNFGIDPARETDTGQLKSLKSALS